VDVVRDTWLDQKKVGQAGLCHKQFYSTRGLVQCQLVCAHASNLQCGVLVGPCIRQDIGPIGFCLTLRLQWHPVASSLPRGAPCRQNGSLAGEVPSEPGLPLEFI